MTQQEKGNSQQSLCGSALNNRKHITTYCAFPTKFLIDPDPVEFKSNLLSFFASYPSSSQFPEQDLLLDFVKDMTINS